MTLDRRKVTVLATLVGSMTLVSAMLLLLEPRPRAPLSGVTLQHIDQRSAIKPEERLFNTAQARAWQAIVIHDSGTLQGSSQTINAVHEKLGWGGLGYHFVINNGSLEPDGLIELGFRWQRQFNGAYFEGQGADWFHQNAIGICLIGDGDRERFSETQLRETLWLVQQLQQRFNIPREQIYIQVGTTPTAAQRFPHAWFRQQLRAGH